MEQKYKPMTQDGMFKMLTWDSEVLTGIFGFPSFVAGPLQQESHEPIERKLDRFYRLEDGSLLNIEHQTSLKRLDLLAERMIRYRMRIRSSFPKPVGVRQAVVYTGREPADRSKIPSKLDYIDAAEGDLSALRYTVPIKDLRGMPAEIFTQSGKVDDLLLGLMGPGQVDRSYVEAVVHRIATMAEGSAYDAKVKLVAICASLDLDLGRRSLDVRIWMEEVMNNPFVKELVEVAGREQIAAARNEGRQEGRQEGRIDTLASVVVNFAVRRGLEVPVDFKDTLTTYADEAQLTSMTDDLDSLSDDVEAFASKHGVILPGFKL